MDRLHSLTILLQGLRDTALVSHTSFYAQYVHNGKCRVCSLLLYGGKSKINKLLLYEPRSSL